MSVQLSSTPADPYGLVDSASDIRPIVFFGDVDVSSAMLGIQTKNAVNTMASANVQFDALAPVLADVDFTSEVTIARGDRDAGRVFTGYAVEAIVEDGFLKVECQGYPALHDPPSGARISRTSAVDNIHTILREAGLPDSRLQLAGLDQLPIEVFEAVIPIDGLILSTRVALGEVVLLPNGSAEEHVLGLIDAPDNPLVGEFQAGRAFAVTYVTAARMYEAERAAIGRVDVAIAWANVRLRFAGAVTPAGELVDWNRARSKQLASRSDLIALRGMLTNRCSLHKMAAPAVTELALTSEQNVSGQGLASDAGLRGAIRAAARAISSPDPLTKITAISECLEFYVGSTDASFGFTKAERRALAKAAQGFTADKKARVGEIIGQLNQSSLMRKLRFQLANDGVPMTKEEMATLLRVRGQRNDVVHGRTDTVDQSDVQHAISLLARVMVHANEQHLMRLRHGNAVGN